MLFQPPSFCRVEGWPGGLPHSPATATSLTTASSDSVRADPSRTGLQGYPVGLGVPQAEQANWRLQAYRSMSATSQASS